MNKSKLKKRTYLLWVKPDNKLSEGHNPDSNPYIQVKSSSLETARKDAHRLARADIQFADMPPTPTGGARGYILCHDVSDSVLNTNI